MTPIEQAIEVLEMARNHMRSTIGAETIAKMDEAITALQSIQGEAVPDELTGEQWSAIRKVIAEYADKIKYAMYSEIESAYLDEAPKAVYVAMLTASGKGE